MTLQEHELKKEAMSEKHTSISLKGSDEFVSIALDELIYFIYINTRTEEDTDALLERMSQIICKELNVAYEKIDWQKLENYKYDIENSMASFYLDTQQITKILNSSKVNKTEKGDHDISSKTFDASIVEDNIIDSLKIDLKDSKIEDSKKSFLL